MSENEAEIARRARRQAEIKTLMGASERFYATGKSDVACGECGPAIQFEDKGFGTFAYRCPCGHYDGTLRA